MAIIDREKGAPWPKVDLLELRLDDIQDDRHSILVVVAHHTLVSVGCVSDHHTVLLARKLGRIVILAELHDLLFFHLHVLLALA